MRKSNAKLLNIPAEQQEALTQWLFEYAPGHTYAQAQQRLKQEFGVEASEDQIGRFYQRKAGEKVMTQAIENGMAGSPLWGAAGNSRVFETLLEITGRLAVDKVMKEGATLSTRELKALSDIAMRGIRLKQQEEREERQEEQLELQRERVEVQKEVAKLKERETAAYEREVALKEAGFQEEKVRWDRKNNPPEPRLMTEEDFKEIEMRAKFM